MKAVQFPEQTAILTAPNCHDLPVFSDGEIVVSKWMPSKEDLVKINNGEGIYLLIVSGHSQPPVNLLVGSPFISQEDANTPTETENKEQA